MTTLSTKAAGTAITTHGWLCQRCCNPISSSWLGLGGLIVAADFMSVSVTSGRDIDRLGNPQIPSFPSHRRLRSVAGSTETKPNPTRVVTFAILWTIGVDLHTQLHCSAEATSTHCEGHSGVAEDVPAKGEGSSKPAPRGRPHPLCPRDLPEPSRPGAPTCGTPRLRRP